MNITINGKPANIALEAEKTVGDVLAGFDRWLSGSGHRLSGVTIDGETAGSGSLTGIFSQELDRVGTLDIHTSALMELMAEALITLRRDIEDYEKAGFEEKKEFHKRWQKSPAALFLSEQIPEIYEWADKSFAGEGVSPGDLLNPVEERLRELQDPAGELNKAEPLIRTIVRRLEDLPLDIQTGKDGRAVETVQLFSNVAEKIFRLFDLMKTEGYDVASLTVENIPVADYIDEFGTALKELLAAYENKDAVLVGDLAEYELAPRFNNLYTAIRIPANAPV
ncbi:MAG: hypothetical protein LBG10_03665 [Treponema sp.]|jgi:hypothetical protein|nr:hypothetical protein [Treponema sp.]